MKITYIISDINKAISFEWIASHFYNNYNIKLNFIFLGCDNSDTVNFFRLNNYSFHLVPCANKIHWPFAFISILKILKATKPDIVHCHLLTANILGLSAAFLSKIKTRIYTRHHSSYHHDYNRKGIFWDNASNFFSTKIVSISSVVTDILLNVEGVDDSKVYNIPHGFDLSNFSNVSENRIQSFFSRTNIPKDKFIIGVASRFVDWKGLQFIFPAFSDLLINNNVHLLLLNSFGSFEDVVFDYLSKLPQNSYTLVRFENDMPAAYASMDVFVHVPINAHVEAFGQVYVEALASGIPSVFTLSGIASEFVVHRNNALVVPFCDVSSIVSSIQELINDRNLREQLSEAGLASVQEKYSLSKMLISLEKLYSH